MTITLTPNIKHITILMFVLFTNLIVAATPNDKQYNNFQQLLTYFNKIPATISNSTLQRISKTGKNIAPDFHQNNYQQYAERIVPIGKISVNNSHILIVGVVEKDVSSDKSVTNVHAFLVDENGDLKDTEKYLTRTGDLAFQKKRFVGGIEEKDSMYHFYDEEVDLDSNQRSYKTVVYKMTSSKIDYQRTIND